MAALSLTVKRAIVQRLAVFETPSEVVDAVREEFGVDIGRDHVNNFDASRPFARGRMAKALVALFDRTRAAFREQTEHIPIANKAYRLKRLDRLARDAKSPKLEADLLEQAAREMGEAYTNRHVVDARVVGTGLTLSAEDLSRDDVDLDKLVQGYFSLGS